MLRILCGRAGVAKRGSLKSYWLSVYAGSSPAVRSFFFRFASGSLKKPKRNAKFLLVQEPKNAKAFLVQEILRNFFGILRDFFGTKKCSKHFLFKLLCNFEPGKTGPKCSPTTSALSTYKPFIFWSIQKDINR